MKMSKGILKDSAAVSCGQLLAPLVSPALQDILSGFGTHALKKAVRSFSFQVAWLECPFQGSISVSLYKGYYNAEPVLPVVY